MTLAFLAIPVEPLLATAGHRVPFVGALHALSGVAIFALTGWVLAGDLPPPGGSLIVSARWIPGPAIKPAGSPER